eukprot:13136291-Ditylum_brightwellii.AAC.2
MAKSNNRDVACGYEAWRKLEEWFLDDTQKNTMAQHFEGKLRDLCLDINVTATNFINNFKRFIQKLGKLEGTDWSDDKKV